tara:strand:- start:109 stop:231 length:123 start_codon:yes stop_codon:yes gene_type:complete
MPISDPFRHILRLLIFAVETIAEGIYIAPGKLHQNQFTAP